jgi:hypothetical protein
VSEETEKPAGAGDLHEEISERIRAVKNPAERRTVAGLLREISRLPLEHTRAA